MWALEEFYRELTWKTENGATKDCPGGKLRSDSRAEAAVPPPRKTDHKKQVGAPRRRDSCALGSSHMLGKLPHYLHIERRRAGFTQRDVAVLLGIRSESKISRYERRRSLPPLQTALAYEVIFGRPVAQLFPGTYAAVRQLVRRRARTAAERVVGNRAMPRSARRKGSLQAITHR
jgi:transcriptional regulator with XRE-family HTH domain